MQFGQLLHHHQAKPRALVLATQRAVNLCERLEQPGLIRRGNPDAGIRYRDLEKARERLVRAVAVLASAHSHFDIAARRREFDRIRKEVVQNLRDLALIKPYFIEIGGDGQSPFRARRKARPGSGRRR